MSLLRIDTSILGPHSSSRELADIVQKHWLEEHADATVVARDLAANPIPATYWPAAVSAGQTPEDQRSDEQKAATALASELYDELSSAETVIVATGLYNYGVNQLLKSWIDLLITDSRTLGGAPVLTGKDIALVIARGGYYGPGAPREGWDYQTGYLVRIFSEVFGGNLSVVDREFTLVGVNPALDDFKEQAAELHAGAKEKSEIVGKELAAAYSARKSA